MKKITFAIISVVIYLTLLAVVGFNNLYQFLTDALSDKDLLASFLLLLLGIFVYFLVNRWELKKLLKKWM